MTALFLSDKNSKKQAFYSCLAKFCLALNSYTLYNDIGVKDLKLHTFDRMWFKGIESRPNMNI